MNKNLASFIFYSLVLSSCFPTADIITAKNYLLDRNYKAAKLELERLKPHAEANFLLGSIYLQGLGVMADASKAVALYKEAADSGSAEAQYNLALIYYSGTLLPKNIKTAVNYALEAASAKLAPAMNLLAGIYEKNETNPPSTNSSFELYSEACNLGYALSCYNIGRLYYHGTLLHQDFEKAFNFFEFSAQKGVDDARYYLGLHYLNGIAVIKNQKTAATQFIRSALAGSSPAKLELAKMLFSGEGLPADRVSAIAILNSIYEQDARSQLVNQLTPDELQQSIERSNQFKNGATLDAYLKSLLASIS